MGGQGTRSLGAERTELDAVLASERFSRSPRLAKLLLYLCQKYFEGQADQIKEYNIATEVLGRPFDFDPSQDAIARVEAHRLRKKLREYYAAEGAYHELKIVLSPGTYVPVFRKGHGLAAASRVEDEDTDPGGLTAIVSDLRAEPIATPVPPPETANSAPIALPHPVKKPSRLLLAAVVAAALGTAAISAWKYSSRQPAPAPDSPPGRLSETLLPVSTGAAAGIPDAPIRLLAGCTIHGHTDPLGNVWGCDRYFSGGRPGNCPHEFVWRTNDPMLFQNVRTGEFSYDIPLRPGSYELHLFFLETIYGPGMSTGGGENSRTFLIKMNGQTLMDNFDVVADANGPNVADERVFRDVHPDTDGQLHLEFISERGQPIISAIEVLPGMSNRQLPIRFVTQRNSFTDHLGRLWNPDSFYSGGQMSIHKAEVSGTPDPDLYAGERYGNFSYAIPTDSRDSYTVTLHFAETYWGGSQAPAGSGVGNRVFNVNCNGVRLLENFDVYKQVGGMRALTKTFHGLKPNAQGKLVLSFDPVVNYASVFGIEVEDEGR